MIPIYDLSNAPRSAKFYGGSSGPNIGLVIYGQDWLVKRRDQLPEFVGSKIYSMLGIDVQRTVLGIRNKTVVVACEDFVKRDESLVEFGRLNNATSDGANGSVGHPSGGNSLYINDVLRTLRAAPCLYENEAAIRRFWDMFVVDTLIGNAERTNDNWGFFSTPNGLSLAPVYDNGGARLSPVDSAKSCYLDDDGRPIDPVRYIQSMRSEDCNAAARRLANAFDMSTIESLLAAIPEKVRGIEILPESTKQLYAETLSTRFRTIFGPFR